MTEKTKMPDAGIKVNDAKKMATPPAPPKVAELDEADLDKVAGGATGKNSG